MEKDGVMGTKGLLGERAYGEEGYGVRRGWGGMNKRQGLGLRGVVGSVVVKRVMGRIRSKRVCG